MIFSPLKLQLKMFWTPSQNDFLHYSSMFDIYLGIVKCDQPWGEEILLYPMAYMDRDQIIPRSFQAENHYNQSCCNSEF